MSGYGVGAAMTVLMIKFMEIHQMLPFQGWT